MGMIRTGAASGLAARRPPRPDARYGVFGANWQAEGHVLALPAALRWRRSRYSVAMRKKQAFCRRLSEAMRVPVFAAASAEDSLRGSDLLGTLRRRPSRCSTPNGWRRARTSTRPVPMH